MVLCGTLLYCVVLYGTLWYSMVLYVWYCAVLCGTVWLYGTVWYCMVPCGTVRFNHTHVMDYSNSNSPEPILTSEVDEACTVSFFEGNVCNIIIT